MRLTRRGTFAAGAALAAAPLAAGCGEDDDPPARAFAAGDGEVVRFALTLEYLEADFYEQVEEAEVLSGRALELVRRIGADEQAHVEALEAAARRSGGPPPERPATDFASVLAGGSRRVLSTAADLEATGAAAYLGQVRSIQTPAVLELALSIHSNEGRHSAALNELIGRPFTPDGAFGAALGRSEVMRRIAPFVGAA